MVNLPIWAFILILLGVLIVGFVAGFFTARAIITKQLEKIHQLTKNDSYNVPTNGSYAIENKFVKLWPK